MKARPTLLGALFVAASVLPAAAQDDQAAKGVAPVGSISAVVSARASKNLSGVKLYYTDGTSHTYSNLSASCAACAVPAADRGKFITRVEVKVRGSSATTSLADTASHTNSSDTFIVTFVQGAAIPPDHSAGVHADVQRFARSGRDAFSVFKLDSPFFGGKDRDFTFEPPTRVDYADPALGTDRLVFGVSSVSGDDDDPACINTEPDRGEVADDNRDFDFFDPQRRIAAPDPTIQTTLRFAPNTDD